MLNCLNIKRNALASADLQIQQDKKSHKDSCWENVFFNCIIVILLFALLLNHCWCRMWIQVMLKFILYMHVHLAYACVVQLIHKYFVYTWSTISSYVSYLWICQEDDLAHAPTITTIRPTDSTIVYCYEMQTIMMHLSHI